MTDHSDRIERLAGAVVMWRAHIEGQQAARDGLRATACPYNPFAEGVEGAVERAQARMWIRGYDRVNPAPIDYSD